MIQCCTKHLHQIYTNISTALLCNMLESIYHWSHYNVAIKLSDGNINSDTSQKLVKPIYECTYSPCTYWSRSIKMQTEIAPNSYPIIATF